MDELPSEPRWQFEPKWDGFRCLAFPSGSGKPLARYFPEVVRLLQSLPQKRFVLDGELVIQEDARSCHSDVRNGLLGSPSASSFEVLQTVRQMALSLSPATTLATFLALMGGEQLFWMTVRSNGMSDGSRPERKIHRKTPTLNGERSLEPDLATIDASIGECHVGHAADGEQEDETERP